jgi:hypothetical protein
VPVFVAAEGGFPVALPTSPLPLIDRKPKFWVFVFSIVRKKRVSPYYIIFKRAWQTIAFCVLQRRGCGQVVEQNTSKTKKF